VLHSGLLATLFHGLESHEDGEITNEVLHRTDFRLISCLVMAAVLLMSSKQHWFRFLCGRCIKILMEFWEQETRRPASADRTVHRQFQATGQPVSRTQASDAMMSCLPRYEAKCVQRRCFHCGSVPLHSDMKGMELSPANILIPPERQLIVLQLCRWEFLYNETLQQTVHPLLSKLSKRRQI